MSTAQLDAPEVIRAVVPDTDDPDYVKPDPDITLRGVIPLLIEYTQKLKDLSWIETPKRGTKVDSPIKATLFAAKTLAQFVSQRLNWPKDDLLRMELQLRLAEYEMVYLAAEKRILGT